MREIKFRAWDRGKMTYQPLAYDEWTTELQPLNPVIDSIQKDKNQILMQYTGLKDKNGKGIYEGDIVRDIDSEISEIVFDDCCYLCRYYPKKGEEFTDGFGVEEYSDVILKGEDRLEVIGNIYENPELIK